MKKALLCCSGGFSSTAVAQALDNFSIKEGYKWSAMGIAAGGFNPDEFDSYAVILVSPQIRFRYPEIKKICDEKQIVSLQIPPNLYYPNKAKELWDEVIKVLNQ
ncbi:hypothetical protein SCLARK_001361 [Spiroplasma clarkii]|uniref:PTS system, cellobiose-specific IIB component n=1 Tax=Spiroplasma clarkii TaxID=2139 RepID=A0A1Y0L2A5_9MOLU|nr:hypothetical protein [Spiroplasma clarkii]ARU91890.1 hypothetical protein SCLARK_001361 [Spiroplasma clarkii]ATX71236.1 PTS system, cellobiose-specific IIB component [Spiroplasma clarkii]